MNILDVWPEFNRRLAHIGPVVIAGGSVRDCLMNRDPKDYDIFVLRTRFVGEKQQAVKLALEDLDVIQPLTFHQSEPYLVGSWRYHGAMVQVMLNPADDAVELVDTFDWNICGFTYEGGDGHYQHEKARLPEPGAKLELISCRFPLSTLRRGFRFSERYEMILPLETSRDLCRQVATRELIGPHGATPDMQALESNTLVS